VSLTRDEKSIKADLAGMTQKILQ